MGARLLSMMVFDEKASIRGHVVDITDDAIDGDALLKQRHRRAGFERGRVERHRCRHHVAGRVEIVNLFSVAPPSWERATFGRDLRLAGDAADAWGRRG